MAKRRASSSVAALVLARVAQRHAEEDNDPEMMADAIELENRALGAIKAHQNVLPPKPPVFRLRSELNMPAPVQLRLAGL